MWRCPTKEEFLLWDIETRKVKKFAKIFDILCFILFTIIFLFFILPVIKVFSISKMISLILPIIFLFLIYTINKMVHQVISPICDTKNLSVCEVVIKREDKDAIKKTRFIVKDKEKVQYTVEKVFDTEISSFKKGAKKLIYKSNKYENTYYFFPENK